MNLKDNLFNALHENECEKTPVVAFPTVLTTELLYKSKTTFDEACHDADKMAQVAGLVYEYADLEAITVPLDLWFEAESFGHVVQRQEGSITPVVTEAPFKNVDDIEIPSDFVSRGQFPVIEEAVGILHERYDDCDVPIIGEITGAFTLLTDLVDMGEIIKMLNSDYLEIDDALEDINKVLLDEVKFYQDIGVDCIVVNDPSSTAKILKPDLFNDLVQPYLLDLSDMIDVSSVLHICGDTNSNVENMLSCGYDGLSISQEVDIAYARQVKDDIGSDTVICGNLAIGETLLLDSIEGIKRKTYDCLDKNVDVLGPSCNIAYETPSNNIRAMVEARNEYFE